MNIMYVYMIWASVYIITQKCLIRELEVQLISVFFFQKKEPQSSSNIFQYWTYLFNIEDNNNNII